MKERLSEDVIRAHKGTSFVGVTTCFQLYDGSGEIFLALRSQKARDEKGRWECGGGGLKWGVAAVDNVRREIAEEFAAQPREIEFWGYRDVFRELDDGTPTHWLGLDYGVLVDRSQVKINEPDMFDDSGWFTFDNLPSPLHSQMNRHFRLYAPFYERMLHPR